MLKEACVFAEVVTFAAFPQSHPLTRYIGYVLFQRTHHVKCYHLPNTPQTSWTWRM